MLPFSIVEATLYNLIRAVPLAFLGYYPFMDKRRFSRKTTVFFFELIIVVWTGICLFSIYFAGSQLWKALIEIAGIALIATLYAVSINAPPGKMLFFCFILINMGYLLTVSSKWLENILFPDYVFGRYMWTASLCLVIVTPVIVYPVYRFFKWEKEILAVEMHSELIWKFGWLIPTTFYLIWARSFYENDNPISWIISTKNMGYLLIINMASFLIYYIVLRVVIDNTQNMRLREENHALTLQIMQYNELNQRIATARQGRHDLRHHVMAMETLLNEGRVDELRNYLESINARYQLDSALVYCSNSTVNAILMYFANEARTKEIDFTVSIGIPEDIRLEKSDLSIVFGNLIENAIEACERQKSGEKKIDIRGQTTEHTLAVTVDNTYEVTPVLDKRGRFRSTKHSGHGIGTESVKSIVERYHGVIDFETKGDLFCVSFMLYLNDK